MDLTICLASATDWVGMVIEYLNSMSMKTHLSSFPVADVCLIGPILLADICDPGLFTLLDTGWFGFLFSLFL